MRIRIGRDGVLVLLLALLSLGWSALGISRASELSRYDEWTYIDYARKAASGHLPAPGEELADATLRDWSCRGVVGDIRDVTTPSCEEAEAALASNGGADRSAWPLEGENYNAFHPPIYFLAAGYGGTMLSAVTGCDFVTGARWISALFVTGGVVALFLAIRAWRASRTVACAGALLMLATPSVAAAATIVHNDAVTPLAGAAAVWLGARIFVQRRYGWILPAAVVTAIASARVMSAAAVLVVLALVLLAALVPRFAGTTAAERRPLLAVAASGIGALLVTYGAWAAWQATRTAPGYVPAISGLSTRQASGRRIWDILASLDDAYGLTHPATDWYMQPSLKSDLTVSWSTALYWFYLLVPILALAVLWRRSSRALPSRVPATAAVAGPLAVAVLVQTRELATSGRYFGVVSGRYAMSIVPLVTCAAALALDGRRCTRLAFLGWAVLGYAAIVSGPLLAG